MNRSSLHQPTDRVSGRRLALAFALAAAALSGCGDDDQAARTNPTGSERSANAANSPGGTTTGQPATPARPSNGTAAGATGSATGNATGSAAPSTGSTDATPGQMAAATPAPARPNAEANAAVGTSERKFVATAASGGMMEVEAGKLGQERGQSPAVKQFGQMLVSDHEQANAELKELATRKGIELPTQMIKEHQAQLDKLRKAKAAEFDRMYIEHVGMDEHKKDIAAFERVIRESNDPEVRGFAQKTLPVLQKHREQAQQLASNTRSSGATPSSNTATGSAGGAGQGGTPGAGGTPGGSSSSTGGMK